MRWLANRPNNIILISDADELLDSDSVMGLNFRLLDCVKPRLRFYYYCLTCGIGTWSMQTLFNSSGRWFHNVSAAESYSDIRFPDGCRESAELMGWHVSYALTTAEIINKLESFSHVNDNFVLELLRDPQREHLIKERVRNCQDIFVREWKIPLAPDIDPKTPPLRGMPSHESCHVPM